MFHPGLDMDDDEERERIACSISRNAAFQLIDDAVVKLEEHDDCRDLFVYAYLWPRIFYSLDMAGFSARSGVRRRPDHNPLFEYSTSKREFVWRGKTYPAPSAFRPSPRFRRRR